MSDTMTAEEAVELLTKADTASSEEAQAQAESEDEAIPASEPGGTAEAEGDVSEEIEETEEEGEPLFTVKVDGVESQVTAQELVNSYQLQKHLDNKLSEVNRERTTLGQDRQKLTNDQSVTAQERQRYIEGLQVLQQALAERGLEDPDPELLESNPVEFVRQKTEVDKRRVRLQQLEDERQREYAKAQDEFSTKVEQAKQESIKRLQSDIPDWQDKSKMESDIRAIEAHSMEHYGLTEQEISSVYDHRYVKILRDAHAYHQLMAKGREIGQKKAKSAAPTIPRGTLKAKPKSDADKAMAKFNQALTSDPYDTESHVDAAADLLLSRAQRG